MNPSHRVSRTTLTEGAAEVMRQTIRTGEIPLGSPLRQEDPAARLGISRTPLREAIARLASEGLVINDAHCGAVVYRPPVENLVESFESLAVVGFVSRHLENRDA